MIRPRDGRPPDRQRSQYHRPMVVLLLALLAAAGFWLATLLVATTLGRSSWFHQVSVVIAAGILFGVAIADLVPESFELLGGTDAALAIVGGFLVLYLVEALTHAHTHHHEPHAEHAAAHAHSHAHAHAHDHAPVSDEPPCVPTHAVLPFLLGLGLHNFADGIVIGASHEVSDSAATGVAIGILVHQLPVGLSFAAVLLASGVSWRRMHLQAALVASMIVVGALVVLAAADLSGGTLGALIGAAAGALIYIATGHLLPEAHREDRRLGVVLAFAIALIGTVFFVGAMHEESHGHDDEHEPAAAHADE